MQQRMPGRLQLIVEDDILEAKAGNLWADSSASGQEPLSLQNAPDRLFLRCERQTLTRLPKTGGVLFTIRTYSRTLRDVLVRPDGRDLAGRLAAASAALPDVTVSLLLPDPPPPPPRSPGHVHSLQPNS